MDVYELRFQKLFVEAASVFEGMSPKAGSGFLAMSMVEAYTSFSKRVKELGKDLLTIRTIDLINLMEEDQKLLELDDTYTRVYFVMSIVHFQKTTGAPIQETNLDLSFLSSMAKVIPRGDIRKLVGLPDELTPEEKERMEDAVEVWGKNGKHTITMVNVMLDEKFLLDLVLYMRSDSFHRDITIGYSSLSAANDTFFNTKLPMIGLASAPCRWARVMFYTHLLRYYPFLMHAALGRDMVSRSVSLLKDSVGFYLWLCSEMDKEHWIYSTSSKAELSNNRAQLHRTRIFEIPKDVLSWAMRMGNKEGDLFMPDKLPFPQIWLSYVPSAMTFDISHDRTHIFSTAGHFISNNNIYVVRWICAFGSSRWEIVDLRKKGEWLSGNSGASIILDWDVRVVSFVLKWLTENSTSFKDNRPHEYRKKFDQSKVFKEKRLAPPPYYRVSLNSSEIAASIKSGDTDLEGRVKLERSYRWDVRGHYALRYCGGDKPLTKDQVSDLTKRGYKIFDKGVQPDEDIVPHLKRRGITKKDGEWLAVLLYWRKDTIKGPKDKPYVPSIRRPSINTLIASESLMEGGTSLETLTECQEENPVLGEVG